MGSSGLGILTSRHNNMAKVNEESHRTAFVKKSFQSFSLYNGINS
jgi:hypothetical protein